MAVFTPLDETQMRSVLALYSVGEYAGHEGILEGVENSNFCVATTNGKFILTLFESRTNTADLPFFFSYAKHLAGKGIMCPGPFLTKDKSSQITVAGRQAALFPYLPGKSLDVVDINKDCCNQLGQMTAQMHQAVADFSVQRANPLSWQGWKRLADKTGSESDAVSPGLSVLIEDELKWLQDHWPSDLPSGAVHLDIFPDNVFFDKGRLSAVIDFYFSATDFFVYDLAIVINAWCFDQKFEFQSALCSALLEGYQKIRPLSAEEKEALPVLLRAASMRFLMTRLHDWIFHDPARFVKPHDPLAYLARLQFHQKEHISL